MFGLIPYYPHPTVEFFGVEIGAWETLVVISFLMGVGLAMRAAARAGLNPAVIADYGPWAMIFGFTTAHLVHVFAYHPEQLAERWWFVFEIWSGLSSFGGFLGAAIALVIFFRRRAESFFHYADSLALGLVPAWTLARVGCFLAHDHKGELSQAALAVNFPDGARHDLGLYEAIVSLVICLMIYGVARARPRFGVLGAITCVVYAVSRFFLDFLRAKDLDVSDTRYLDLTPAQYGCFALLVFGVYLWRRSKGEPRPGETHAQPEPSSS